MTDEMWEAAAMSAEDPRWALESPNDCAEDWETTCGYG